MVWLFLGIGLIAIAGAVLLLVRSYRKRPQTEQRHSRIFKHRARTARKRALGKLADLEADFEAGRIDSRQAHRQLSAEIRGFAHEMTGVRVENMTLSEVRKLNDPHISALMELCYTSEFSPGAEADTKADIARGKELIETWR